MRRFVSALLAIGIVLTMSACGASGAQRGQTVNQAKTVSDILDAAGANADSESGMASPAEPPAASVRETIPESSASGELDVDLTTMNSTMVYTEVFQMMQAPDQYMGKTVKMTGSFAVYEGDGRNYYACLIADATACCSQGIEFLWKGDHSYPADYPAPGTEITVTGIFDTYYEGDYMYCQLIDAEVSF